MKKITFLFLLVFAIAKTNAQNFQISFAGTGASTTVDSVQVENLTQCTDTSLGGGDTLQLSGTIGINELNSVEDNAINIYPNPNTGNCSVDFFAAEQGKTYLTLYDLTGKRILEVQEFLSKGHHSYRLSGISNGIYLLKIESDSYSYTTKLVSTNSTSDIAEIKHIEATSVINLQSTYSNTGKLRQSKSINSTITMQYTTGDILMLTGKSGIYRTVFILIPTHNQTVTFNFDTCTDADGNNYSVVQIGTQIWMAENLRTTKYRNGTSIANITSNAYWGNQMTGAWCSYGNTTNSSIIKTYGLLYNWYAVNDTSNIAPQGWHVASDAEITTLASYLGGGSVAGGKLKEKCKTYWNSPNTGATNRVGFTALPAGYRNNNSGTFTSIGNIGYWWTATQYDATQARFFRMDYNVVTFLGGPADMNYGFSVRCIKD